MTNVTPHISVKRFRLRKNGGVSLLELVLVLSILAVISAIAMPRFAGAIQNATLDQMSRRVAMDLRVAQSNAIRLQRQQDVLYETVANRYTLAGMTHPDRRTQAYVISITELSGGSVQLSSANFNGSTCSFDRYGSPLVPGTVVLSLGIQTKTVRVAAGSGRITIE